MLKGYQTLCGRRTISSVSPFKRSFSKRSIIRYSIILSTSAFVTWTYKDLIKQKYVETFTKTKELSPNDFTEYKITRRYDIDNCHYLIELTPLKRQNVNLWKELERNILWSIEVKQPEIMVVRNYTPLPLQLKSNGNIVPLDLNDPVESKKLLFYIKSYNNGEVARWIKSLPVGSTLELRGPFIDYKFRNDLSKHHRDANGSTLINKTQLSNVPFFAGGTGIVTALQPILNPYGQFNYNMTLFHSCKSIQELGCLYHLVNGLAQQNKITYHLFETSKGDNIIDFKQLIPGPNTSNAGNFDTSIVCGPEGT
ncbi:uncharacterized protein CGFF_03753 [Nakaseomyces glabratus]|nr:uncharacterized protein CGFF_03753 [Nakaseomyces glabratus]SLM15962.1 uncharacterized protein CGFF_03753 [Nakaseomyces glabratus]